MERDITARHKVHCPYRNRIEQVREGRVPLKMCRHHKQVCEECHACYCRERALKFRKTRARRARQRKGQPSSQSE